MHQNIFNYSNAKLTAKIHQHPDFLQECPDFVDKCGPDEELDAYDDQTVFSYKNTSPYKSIATVSKTLRDSIQIKNDY